MGTPAGRAAAAGRRQPVRHARRPPAGGRACTWRGACGRTRRRRAPCTRCIEPGPPAGPSEGHRDRSRRPAASLAARLPGRGIRRFRTPNRAWHGGVEGGERHAERPRLDCSTARPTSQSWPWLQSGISGASQTPSQVEARRAIRGLVHRSVRLWGQAGLCADQPFSGTIDRAARTLACLPRCRVGSLPRA